MKTVYDLIKNQTATIRKIHAQGELKARLISLGFQKGAEIEVLECAPGKQTMQIKVDQMKLALRMNEAKEIEINEPIN